MIPEQFVSDLARVNLDNVFNPYSDTCPIHDRVDAPAIRRRNLSSFLACSINARVRTMWIGRDLGYLGGRRTGLALTDEVRLSTCASNFSELALRQATEGQPIGERTASVIWGVLNQVNEPVFLWNAFPLHPHVKDKPMTNRCHTRSERMACKPLFFRLLDMLRPEIVVAIGNDAADALTDMGVASRRVRHPSYGGKRDFIRGMGAIYDLPDEQCTQGRLL